MTSAVLLTALLVVLACFQLALALGAPLGRFGWGGQQTSQYVQAHSVTWFQSGSDVVVLADTDGNLATAEFSMILTGISSLNQNDFLL